MKVGNLRIKTFAKNLNGMKLCSDIPCHGLKPWKEDVHLFTKI
jgi:hypothetical protein